MGKPREFEFKVGRRVSDGTLRLSTFLPHLLSISISHKGERATTVVLTREQVRELRSALAELEPLIEPNEPPAGPWNGEERRGGGS